MRSDVLDTVQASSPVCAASERGGLLMTNMTSQRMSWLQEGLEPVRWERIDGGSVLKAGYRKHYRNLYPDPIVPNAAWVKERRDLLGPKLGHLYTDVMQHAHPQAHDYSVYTGTGGFAYLALRLALDLGCPEGDAYLQRAKTLLLGAKERVLKERQHHGRTREGVSFVLGPPGIWSMLAVLHMAEGDEQAMAQALRELLSYKESLFRGSYPFEVLYGAAGYLSSLLFAHAHLHAQTEASQAHLHTTQRGTDPSADRSPSGQASANVSPPQASSLVSLPQAIADVAAHILHTAERGPGGVLLPPWHGKAYLGGAHGLSGILCTLLDASTIVPFSDEDMRLVRESIHYLRSLALPSGNYPSRPDSTRDELVQWCHGAPGPVLLFTRAFELFEDPRYLAWAEEGADVIWARGLLTKGVGLCHGVGGNAYPFLSLYRATGNDRFLQRALTFALAADELGVSDKARADHPHSLFEGRAGLAMLYFELLARGGQAAGFPAVDMPLL